LMSMEDMNVLSLVTVETNSDSTGARGLLPKAATLA
jgi:hypothetical protein